MSDFVYDQVPYPSFTFPQTHPDRLATLAAVCGMTPAKVDRCRVLELGCGDGTNILSFAYALPQSQFVGIDLSATHIARAKTAAAELNLSNAAFHELDVLAVNREQFGEFDFIIAHGLFSWVPEAVRERILEIYREMLAPAGVGYISYNAFPGCHAREMAWKMMKYHTRNMPEPAEKVRHAVGFLDFLVKTSDSASFYHSLLENEFEGLSERQTQNVFHDDLADLNQPFYFHEFAAQIEQRDLQFLAEVEITHMQTSNLPAQVRHAIESFGDDVVSREQYLDFFRFRRFRQTLVCRRAVALARQFKKNDLNCFFVQAQLANESAEPNISERAPEKFVGAKGATFAIDHPLTKAALVLLVKQGARSIRFDDLLERAKQMIELASSQTDFDFAREKQQTANFFWQLYEAGFVKLHVYRFDFADSVSERPRASDFARRQAARGDFVTALTGVNLPLENDFMRELLLLLDGTRNKDELRRQLAAQLAPDDANQPAADSILHTDLLERSLLEMAANGLLIS